MSHPLDSAIERMLTGGRSAQRDEPLDPVKQAGVASTLLERFATLEVKHDLKPGDLVEWKPGCKVKNGFGLYIVTRVLDEAITAPGDNHGTQFFREPLDIVVADIAGDGEFVEYHFDSRRMQPYTGKLAEDI